MFWRIRTFSTKTINEKLYNIIAILARCNNPKERNDKLDNRGVPTASAPDKTKKSAFAGVWVNKKYVEKLGV
jgi:hypothetical protein